jgi:hypothetical protein
MIHPVTYTEEFPQNAIFLGYQRLNPVAFASGFILSRNVDHDSDSATNLHAIFGFLVSNGYGRAKPFCFAGKKVTSC